MKNLRFASRIMIAVAFLSIVTAVTALANAPVGDSAANAMIIDNQAHAIPANGNVWFRFDYNATDRTIATITLPNANNGKLGFEVWTPDSVNNVFDNKPIGRGSLVGVACNSDDSSSQGTCVSNDLTWTGAFASSGTFYIRVLNSSSDVMNVTLRISGVGVSMGTPAIQSDNMPTTLSNPIALPVTPIQPASSAPIAPAMTSIQTIDDPARAVSIDNQPHLIAANSATWFSFNYGGTSLDPRPTKVVSLVNGFKSGVRFEVWTADHMLDWWDGQKPIGQGTGGNVDCGTNQPSDNGTCQSNDLTWTGAFNTGGTYYVRVINDNNQPVTFQLVNN